jgi:hypothetical protein
MMKMREQAIHLDDSSSDNEDGASCLNDFMRTGSFRDSFLDVSKDGNGNLIESNKIIKNSVAFKDKEKGGIKGVNLAMKQTLEDKKNATCFMVKRAIPMTLTEWSVSRPIQASIIEFRPW